VFQFRQGHPGRYMKPPNPSAVQKKRRSPKLARDSAGAHQFIERLGRLAEGEGLPRTAGRMMGALILSPTPLGIDELANRLKVSRASISTNSRLLQSLSIASLVDRPGSRRDYLRISGDPCSSLLSLGLQRMQSMHGAIQEMRCVLDPSRFDELRTRLRRMERFYTEAIRGVEVVLAEWSAGQQRQGPKSQRNMRRR
jgi:DNA-binding transcriptional regulator GbsR (MarR family)